MDNKIHEAKKFLNETELKDFHFSEKQKQNVLRNIRSPEKKTFFTSKVIPIALSILFLTIFAGGMSAIIVNNYSNKQKYSSINRRRRYGIILKYGNEVLYKRNKNY